MKEFDLSKKIYDIDTCPIFSDERRVINVFHIKEFIKLLKEKGKCKNPSQNGEIIYLLSEKEINELAGERLK